VGGGGGGVGGGLHMVGMRIAGGGKVRDRGVGRGIIIIYENSEFAS
jgi:hypothetical protein